MEVDRFFDGGGEGWTISQELWPNVLSVSPPTILKGSDVDAGDLVDLIDVIVGEPESPYTGGRGGLTWEAN